MLSSYGKNEWITIIVIAALGIIACVIAGWWIAAIVIAAIAAALLSFFRDPNRQIPTQRGAMVAPADGRVSSIHDVEYFTPFDGPAICIRIFLSVFNVHVNRSPCHGTVVHTEHKPGKHSNALNPQSAEDNESNLIVIDHSTHNYPLASVRQVSGMIARTIVCDAEQGLILQRGQRLGMIKLGSTTELYLPAYLKPDVNIEQGQKVLGGSTVLAYVSLLNEQGVSNPPQEAADLQQPESIQNQILPGQQPPYEEVEETHYQPESQHTDPPHATQPQEDLPQPIEPKQTWAPSDEQQAATPPPVQPQIEPPIEQEANLDQQQPEIEETTPDTQQTAPQTPIETKPEQSQQKLW